MENWDEKKLEEVVNKKHGEAEKKKPKTQIVCKSASQSLIIQHNKPMCNDSILWSHPGGAVLFISVMSFTGVQALPGCHREQ